MENKVDGTSLLKEWKERLGLFDWEIELVDMMRPEDMSLEDVYGCSVWTECNKTARIEIVDPLFCGERLRPFDYEETLVHELLHLKLTLVSDGVDGLMERYMHQIIDDLARAFIEAKRAGCKGKDGNVL